MHGEPGLHGVSWPPNLEKVLCAWFGTAQRPNQRFAMAGRCCVSLYLGPVADVVVKWTTHSRFAVWVTAAQGIFGKPKSWEPDLFEHGRRQL